MSFWYRVGDDCINHPGVVDLLKACSIHIRLPDAGRIPTSYSIVAQWSTVDEYGKSIEAIYWGTAEECDAELARIMEELDPTTRKAVT